MSALISNRDSPEQEHAKLHAMLLSSVSHDLKTPLACIIGSLDIYQQLKDTLSEERKSSLISTAINEARRLDNFVTNILDMATLESGIPFKRECADIGQLVRQCTLRLAPMLSQYKLQLELPLGVMADVNELWMTRALTLLLDNVAQYTPIHTPIQVAVTSDQLACWITIRDFGPGISKKIASAIFHKHSRAAHEDAKIAGTGLGLPICKAIAEMHGGAIRFEKPAEGEGALFTITLPLHQKKIKAIKKPG